MLMSMALGLALFWHSLFSKPRDPLGAVTSSGSSSQTAGLSRRVQECARSSTNAVWTCW